MARTKITITLDVDYEDNVALAHELTSAVIGAAQRRISLSEEHGEIFGSATIAYGQVTESWSR